MEQNHRLASFTSPLLEDIEQYRRLVGQILYLVFTRPDLVDYVHILSQFWKAAQQDHWDATVGVV